MLLEDDPTSGGAPAALEAEADGALLLLRGRGDRLLLGRRDEALIVVGARDEDLAAVGVGAVAFDASVTVLSDVESLREIGGGVRERARPRRCGGTDLE